MSTRPTKEILTPGGHKVIVNEYLTGGEYRSIQMILMDGTLASDLTGSNNAMDNMAAVKVFRAQERALECLVVSVDGQTENAYQALLDLPNTEITDLFAFASEHLDGGYKKKVSSSQSPSTSQTE